MRRRKSAIFFLILGILLIALAVALNVSWILLNLRQVALLVLGVIFFLLIITGLVLNTIFLVREIKRNEQHDAFLNAVTHELKTPIASIKLYLETLKTREVSEEKRREFYDVMLADSDRLLNTVDQVLQASSAREKKRQLNISRIDIGELVEESGGIILSRYHLDPASIKIVGAEAPAAVFGDRSELQTVFTNLLDNAVKYSDSDPKIFVRIRSSAADDSVSVYVKDSGAGIPASDLKRIFKRFYRVPGTSENAKGTGLGLPIVKSIIERHGGKITAESKGPGKGSTFHVRLPRA